MVGIPYLRRPPILSFLSYTVTKWPACKSEKYKNMFKMCYVFSIFNLNTVGFFLTNIKNNAYSKYQYFNVFYRFKIMLPMYRNASSSFFLTLLSCAAAAIPAGPLPMTATFLPVLCMGGSGTTQPCSKAWSIMVFSMFLMVTAGLFIPSTQAPWTKENDNSKTYVVNNKILRFNIKRCYCKGSVTKLKQLLYQACLYYSHFVTFMYVTSLAAGKRVKEKEMNEFFLFFFSL